MRLIGFLVTLLFTGFAYAQQDRFALKGKFGQDITDFSVDNLGNIFLVNTNGQLKKLSPAGDSVAVYNEIRKFGKLSSLDVSNPLKVLLFYKDFGTIVVLDRFLNRRNTIDARKQNILQAKAIGQSFDNGVWIYDELDGKLKRMDDNGNVISETADFRVLFDAPPSPQVIADADRLVYLYDPEKGLFVLDYFGTVRNKVALLGWTDVQVSGNRVFGRKGNSLASYIPGTLDIREETMPSMLEGVTKVQVSRDQFYIHKDSVLHIYTIKTN